MFIWSQAHMNLLRNIILNINPWINEANNRTYISVSEITAQTTHASYFAYQDQGLRVFSWIITNVELKHTDMIYYMTLIYYYYYTVNATIFSTTSARITIKKVGFH